MNPFNVLEVPVDADDKQVRDAYFRKVKLFPPDRDPDKFRLVRQAFECINTESNRIAARFGFGLSVDPVDLFEGDHADARICVGHKPWLDLIGKKKAASRKR